MRQGLEFWCKPKAILARLPLPKRRWARARCQSAHPSLIMARANSLTRSGVNSWPSKWRLFGSFRILVSANMTGFIGGMDWFQQWQEFDLAGASMYADIEQCQVNFPL